MADGPARQLPAHSARWSCLLAAAGGAARRFAPSAPFCPRAGSARPALPRQRTALPLAALAPAPPVAELGAVEGRGFGSAAGLCMRPGGPGCLVRRGAGGATSVYLSVRTGAGLQS